MQVAAVIGKEVPITWLAAMVNVSETDLEQTLTDLLNAEFLYEMQTGSDPIYTFTHILTQEAAYQSLLEQPRQQYHWQIAELLSTRFPAVAAATPEQLAHHYTEAGRYAQAISYWQRAGQRAVERAAYIEAIQHLTTGLALLNALPDAAEHPQWELDLNLPLGTALAATKGAASPDVEQVYTRARALCEQVGNTPKRFDVLQGLAELHKLRAELQTSQALGQQLLTLPQQHGDPTAQLQSHRLLVTILYHIGDMQAARVHLEQAIALFQPHRNRSQASFMVTNAMATGFGYTALALWQLGYPDQAVQHIQTALALAEELGHSLVLATVLSYTAHLYLLRREMETAQQWAETLMNLATEQGLPHWLAQGRIKRGRALVAQDRIEEGMALIHQGMAAYRATGAEISRPYNLALLAEAYARSEQVCTGLELVDEAFAVSQAAGQLSCETQLYRLKGTLLIERSRNENAYDQQQTRSEAEMSLRRSLELSDQRHMRAWGFRAALTLSQLWQQLGKRELAHQLLAARYAWFTEGFQTLDLQRAKALLEALSPSQHV